MVSAKTTGVAYETVRDLDGQLPLLVPMSEVAGRMAVQIGAHFLTKQEGGSGVLPRWGTRCSQRKSHHHRWWGRWNPRGSYRPWTWCPSDHLRYQC